MHLANVLDAIGAIASPQHADRTPTARWLETIYASTRNRGHAYSTTFPLHTDRFFRNFGTTGTKLA